MYLMARYHLSTHISIGRIAEQCAKHEILMDLTHQREQGRCAAGKGTKPQVKTLRKGWNHEKCGYSTKPLMSEVIQLRQTIELNKFMFYPNFNIFWRTSVYSLAIERGCVSVQRIFISSKNKMYRQLLAVFLVPPEGSGDCKPDFTYYKIQ